jgi:serine/threonine protein kinase
MTMRLPNGSFHELVGQEIGNYRVVRAIGRGGAGVVYEAVDVELGRRVALKVLSGPLGRDPQALQRLLAEARIASALRSPNIVNITGFGRTAGGYGYVVMELLEGESLAQRMRSTYVPMTAGLRSLDWLRSVLRIVRQLAGTMSCVHQHGIVHRDLKPENVFLIPDADVLGGERIKILDFGMAKAHGDYSRSLRPPWPGLTRFEPTLAGTVMGTPAYMAPEQWMSKSVDGRTDVYALGCIFYEMLCGQPPFQGGDLSQFENQHLHQPPPPVRCSVAQDHQPLLELLHHMLAKSPQDRPTMQSVVETVRSIESELFARQDRWTAELICRTSTSSLSIPIHASTDRSSLSPRAALLTAAVAAAVVVLIVVGLLLHREPRSARDGSPDRRIAERGASRSLSS